MATIYARVQRNQQSTYKEITMDQGATFSEEVVLKNIDDTAFDLTNYSVRGKLRRSVASSTATDFTCTVTDAANGTFILSLTSAQTAALTAQNYVTTIYHYDVEIFDSSSPPTVYRVLRGRIFLEPEVTR